MDIFYWVAFAAILTVSASRITRLLTYDKFPPTMWLRETWVILLDGGPRRRQWQRLFFCGYCMGFWVTAGLVLWADLAGVLDGRPAWGGEGALSIPFWFIVNGIFAASYLAAILMAHDGDVSADDEDEN